MLQIIFSISEMNHTYYLNRIFDEIFDMQVRLLIIENQQHDLAINATQVHGSLIEAKPKADFPDGTLLLSWLIML